MNPFDGNGGAEPDMAQPSVPLQAEAPHASLLAIVWRRRWIVVLTLALSLGAGFTYLSRATPLYTSTSKLYVEKTGPRIITESEGVMTQSYNYLYTQGELARSTPILASALERPGIRSLRMLNEVSNPVGYLKSAVQVSVGKKDEIISISLESPYPEEAATLVNAIVDAYITFHANQKRNTAAEVLKILQKEKTRRDAELSSKLKAMLEFKQTNPSLAYEGREGNVILERLARLSEALTAAQLETIDAEAACEATKAMVADPAKLKQFIAARRARGGYGSIQSEEARVRAEIERLELQLAQLGRQVTDTHPAIQGVRERIAALRQRLPELASSFAEAELAVAVQRVEEARQKEAQIRAFFDKQLEEAKGLNTQVAQFTMLKSDWEQTRKLSDILDERIKEINVTEDTGALNITILEVARPASAPTSPQKTRTMAMALAIGMMLGVGLALGLDWIDQRIRSADEVSTILGVPVLGVVPQMRERESIEVKGRKVENDPTSHAAEAYRTIRTAIYFGVPNGNSKRIVVTSPAPGDGKTTLASNLAITMAQAGQRTIVVDADFRRPMQHKVFEVEQEHGLSSVLSARASVDDVIQHTSVELLDVLPCGPVPPNPSEMLNSQAFQDVMAELAERYDHIILDSPPVMPVTDARILGATADITLLVLRAERSHKRAAERARDGLVSVGASILGAVVNAVPRSQDRYYYYSGYGYYHGHRYGYGYGYSHGRDTRAVEDADSGLVGSTEHEGAE